MFNGNWYHPKFLQYRCTQPPLPLAASWPWKLLRSTRWKFEGCYLRLGCWEGQGSRGKNPHELKFSRAQLLLSQQEKTHAHIRCIWAIKSRGGMAMTCLYSNHGVLVDQKCRWKVPPTTPSLVYFGLLGLFSSYDRTTQINASYIYNNIYIYIDWPFL